MTASVDVPLPVLTITTRVEPRLVNVALVESVAALRETARHLGALVVGDPIRVRHDDAHVVEVCLPLASLPDVDPPHPVAAEVLVPGTAVDAIRVP